MDTSQLDFMSDYRPSTDEERNNAIGLFEGFIKQLFEESQNDSNEDYSYNAADGGENMELYLRKLPEYEIATQYISTNTGGKELTRYHIIILDKAHQDVDYYTYETDSNDLIRTVKCIKHAAKSDPKSTENIVSVREAGYDEVHALLEFVQSAR